MCEKKQPADRLPLPVPKLEDTIAQYLAAIQPICTGKSYEQAQQAATAFVARDGAVLQDRLLAYAQSLAGGSWLRDYSRRRFLSLRGPLSIIGNFSLDFTQPSLPADRAEGGAKLARTVARLYRELVRGELSGPEHSSPSLVTDQLTQSLGAARLPRFGQDEYQVYQPFSQVHSFGLFYRNHYYLLRLFDAAGHLVAQDALAKAIRGILTAAPAPLSVNFQTAGFAGSQDCAVFLPRLCQDGNNQEAYQAVCHSLFHLTLDDEPRSDYSFSQVLYGDTRDLWLYKPWSLRLFQDGSLAVNNEHTASDGLSNVFLYERLFTMLAEPEPPEAGISTDCRELVFRFTPAQKEWLEQVQADYKRHIRPFCGSELLWEDIDWAGWRRLGVSRDALIQMAFHYGQLDLYGDFRFTHESVSTAQYHQGRTSCLRSVTPEAVAVVQALRAQAPPQKLLPLLQQASASHSQLIRLAKANVCFIRHSAGLMDMWQRFGPELGLHILPPIWQQEIYQRYSSQELSTSTLGSSPVLRRFGFAPTVTGGLGIGYLSSPTGLEFTCAWNQEQLPQGQRFTSLVETFLRSLPRPETY